MSMTKVRDASAFDERLAATRIPAPGTHPDGLLPEELYEMRRTVTDLGRELHIAYNDLNGATRRTETAQVASPRMEPD